MNPLRLSPSQKENLEVLIKEEKLRKVPLDLDKAERFIEQANLALLELPLIKTVHLRYDGGYNAAHDVGEALLAAYGLRTSTGIGQHVSIGEVLIIFFEGTSAQNAAEDFEDFRRARNQSRYIAIQLGDAQADAVVNCAKNLLMQGKKLLN